MPKNATILEKWLILSVIDRAIKDRINQEMDKNDKTILEGIKQIINRLGLLDTSYITAVSEEIKKKSSTPQSSSQ
jgi:ATP-dependent Lon protease